MSVKYSPSKKDIFLWTTAVFCFVLFFVLFFGYFDVGGKKITILNQKVNNSVLGAYADYLFIVLAFLLAGAAFFCVSPYFAGKKAKKKRIINEALAAIVHFSPHQILPAAAKINLRFSAEGVEASEEIMALAGTRKLTEVIFFCLFALDLSYQITRREAEVFDSLAGLLIQHRLSSDIDKIVELIISGNYPLGYMLMRSVRQARKEEAVNRLLKVMAEQDQEKEKEMAKKNPTKSRAFNRAFQTLVS